MARTFERYLHDIGRLPLLTPEEEAELAARSRRGDRSALHRLASANLRFVVSVARRYQGNGVPLADLVNEGNIGLLRAAERFDETKGVRFVSYAHWWVRRAIVDAIDAHRGVPRGDGGARISLDEPLTQGRGTLQDVLSDPTAATPESDVVEGALRTAVEASLADLPEREALVLRRYFGIGTGGSEDLGQIGRSLGVSRERARQLKERGLARLRSRAGRHDLPGFRGSPKRPHGAGSRGRRLD